MTRRVAQLFEKAVCLETDWFWTTIVKGFIPPWLPESAHQNHVVIRSFTAAAATMAHGGYAVVVDGIVGPWNLDTAVSQFAVAGVEHHYFVLRPARHVALARVTGRSGEERVPGHPALTDEGPILHMWDQFADLGHYENRVIDNSDLDPDDVARSSGTASWSFPEASSNPARAGLL